MTPLTLILSLILPFCGALLSGFVSLKHPKISYWLAVTTLSLGLITAITMFFVSTDQILTYHVGGWSPPYGISLQAGPYASFLIVVIYLVALINLLYNQPLLAKLYPRGKHFYSLYLFLLTSFIGLTLTQDLFNLYVFLEISSLASYALIGRGGGRACRAAFNYLLVGTVGASFYLIGVGFIYLKTGILSFSELFSLLPQQFDSATIKASFAFVLLGLMIKMAVFPVHIWLPNAYAYGPSTSIGLLAPLSTKIALFLMFKIVFEVFSAEYFAQILHIQDVLVNLSAIGIIAMSLLALSQENWIKTFTYLIVVEIGYVFGGFWLQNDLALTGAAYHLLFDIFLTQAIFLFIASMRIYFKSFNEACFANLFTKLPCVGVAFVVTGLALIGLPPTGGFVSKVYLLQGAILEGQWLFMSSLIVASLVTAIIFFKVIEHSLFSSNLMKPAELKTTTKVILNSSALFVAAILIIFGVFQKQIVEHIILTYI